MFCVPHVRFSRNSKEKLIDFLEFPDGEDWLLRPVVRGLCKYESLKDGTLKLHDIMLLNNVLDVQDENERRYQQAANKAK